MLMVIVCHFGSLEKVEGDANLESRVLVTCMDRSLSIQNSDRKHFWFDQQVLYHNLEQLCETSIYRPAGQGEKPY